MIAKTLVLAGLLLAAGTAAAGSYGYPGGSSGGGIDSSMRNHVPRTLYSRGGSQAGNSGTPHTSAFNSVYGISGGGHLHGGAQGSLRTSSSRRQK